MTVEFSEHSQAQALELLSRKAGKEDLTECLLSLTFYKEQDDIPGAFLIMTAWTAAGVHVGELARYARANRNQERFGPILTWLKERLLDPGKDNDMNKRAHEESKAWVEEAKRGILDRIADPKVG